MSCSVGKVLCYDPSMVLSVQCHFIHDTHVPVCFSYLATSGLDGMMKIWDIRTYKPLHKYNTRSPAGCLSFSQRGLLAAGQGSYVNVRQHMFQTVWY